MDMETSLLIEVVVCGALFVAALVDMKRRIIPHACWLAIALSAGAREVLSCCGIGRGPGVASMLGSFLGIGLLLASTALILALLHKPTGIGGGDIKLFLSLALWLGFAQALLVVMLACVFVLLGVLVRKIFYLVPCSGSVPMAPAIACAYGVLLVGKTSHLVFLPGG